MQNTTEEKKYRILNVFVLPLLLFFIAYYGFESSYVKIKGLAEVPDFMFTSVYAYRIIPNYFTVETTVLLKNLIDNLPSAYKTLVLKSGGPFYHAVFIVNCVFFLLSSYLFYRLLPEFQDGVVLKKMLHLSVVFILILVQYVPTNCDMMALVMYLLSILLTQYYLKSGNKNYFILLLAVIFVATMVRETACLSIAFFAAQRLDFKKLKLSNTAHILEIAALIISFLLPYILLRLFLPQNTILAEDFYVAQNFSSPYNIAGLITALLLFYFFYHLLDSNGKTWLKKYLFFTSPYLVMISLVGLFWEIRLFLPILITAAWAVGQSYKKICL